MHLVGNSCFLVYYTLLLAGMYFFFSVRTRVIHQMAPLAAPPFAFTALRRREASSSDFSASDTAASACACADSAAAFAASASSLRACAVAAAAADSVAAALALALASLNGAAAFSPVLCVDTTA
eukprot:TRINITY_DN1691_c0_g3_i3.p2 TRINITY_DN1691_c0_g3~~TRINITY_DN1691_c0_g3_i3.p2  ORF type:complete len:124 (-),score=13.19 TRINITY_DN1691_c0_g3_i3:2-373(-)